MRSIGTTLLLGCLLAGVARGEAPCPPDEACAAGHGGETYSVSAKQVARDATLMGDNCSYSTEMMIAQVLMHGQKWVVRATLRPASSLPTKIAAPYVIGPDDARVLANGLLDELSVLGGTEAAVVSVEGRVMRVHGQDFMVITALADPPPS